VKPVLDTNILVDFLRGVEAAREELARYPRAAVSLVTWMEILVGAADPVEEETLRAFVSRFEVLPVSLPVAERAVLLRRHHRLRLPDAVIWATAQVHERLFVTRNTRDFPADDPAVRIPYRR